MSKKNREALAEIRAKLGGIGEKPVDLTSWKDAVAAAFDAKQAGRPFSMVPPKNPKPLSPAAQRMMARYAQMRAALRRDGVKVWG